MKKNPDASQDRRRRCHGYGLLNLNRVLLAIAFLALPLFFLVASKADNQDQANQALIRAANNGDLNGVIEALDQGADINFRDPNQQQTPLIHASKKNHKDVVAFLLGNREVDINAQDNIGETALYTAAGECNPAIVELLLKKKADPNLGITNKTYQKGVYYGWNPLDIAVYLGRCPTKSKNTRCEAVITLLKNHGGKIGGTDDCVRKLVDSAPSAGVITVTTNSAKAPKVTGCAAGQQSCGKFACYNPKEQCCCATPGKEDHEVKGNPEHKSCYCVCSPGLCRPPG